MQEQSRSWFTHKAISDVSKALAEAPDNPKAWHKCAANKLGFLSLSQDERDFGLALSSLYTSRQIADYFNQTAVGQNSGGYRPLNGSGDARKAYREAEKVIRQVQDWSATNFDGFKLIAFQMLKKSLNPKIA